MTDEQRLSQLANVAGRGFIVNALFEGGLQAMLLLQSLLVPRLLGPANVGLFALAMAAVNVGFTLK
ncbi:MAG: hypothetical protein QOG03_1217, partial [Actinomycetota bacterium]|nr:hypothetical protein [Actinomycetota bacterium]